MLARQRKISLGMIERRRHASRLPAACAVACFAGLDEASLVRILMAVIARSESHPREFRCALHPTASVALLARYLGVKSGERKARGGVIES